MTVRTRFAPSPTGDLHLGGARTALFNWLFAKNNCGKFLIRIEDTDTMRSDQLIVKNILEDLQWLNINWDEEIVYQKENITSHLAFANNLLKAGHAYHCYCTYEEVEKIKLESQFNNTKAFRSPWRDKKSKSINEKNSVIRFRVPRKSGMMTFTDQVRGNLSWNLDDIEDFVIVRTDRTPTYNLAVVSDDYQMKISHVIRGEDHLTNTAKQILLYEALEWTKPKFAHIPLIQNQLGEKLSKRDGNNNLEGFKKKGILPVAMLNYMARLGWSYKDEEFFNTKQAISWFSINGIGKSPSKFNEKKLLNICSKHLKCICQDELFDSFFSFIEIQKKLIIKDEQLTFFKPLVSLLRNRSNSLSDIFEQSKFIIFPVDKSIFKRYKNILLDDVILIMKDFLKSIKEESFNWEVSSIEFFIKNFCESNNLTFGHVGIPLRILVTGEPKSASIAHILEILGKAETILRLNSLLADNT